MTQNDLKYYSSLLKKKYRNIEKKFLVEGKKSVEEGLNSNFICEKIFISQKFINDSNSTLFFKDKEFEIIKQPELLKLSDTVNPQGIVAVFKFPPQKKIESLNPGTIIFLENISDPGNLGTIIRTCDWFGINTLLLSTNTVDVYNPKVIRSTMGSIFHLNIIDDLGSESLDALKKKHYKIICADIEGKSVYEFNKPDKIVIAFSNETTGPSEELLKISDYKINIPRIGSAESLNVASASAIILSELTKTK